MNPRKWSPGPAAAVAALVVLVLTSVTVPPSVHAATTRTIGVDDVPDDFPVLGCSLREAIAVANAGLTGTHLGCTVNQSGSGSPITYYIDLPKAKYTYTLTGAAGENGNASGDLDITANVTISGQGAVGSIIDGGEIDRVFHICPGGGCGNSVTLAGVTIRNGNVTGNGGGICNQGGTVMVDSSTVSDNAVSGAVAFGNGGGICNLSGVLSVRNSTVSDNKASDGGGIYTDDGTVTVDGSTIGSNTAARGGGIYNSGTTTVDGRQHHH